MEYKYYQNMALQDFRNYNCLKASLEILPRQIALLQNTGITTAAAGERVMHSVSTDDAVVAHISRIEQMEKALEHNRTVIQCIDTALNALGKRDRDILFSFYINRQRGSVTNTARQDFTDRSTLYRRAMRALERYIFACYGVQKTALPADADLCGTQFLINRK